MSVAIENRIGPKHFNIDIPRLFSYPNKPSSTPTILFETAANANLGFVSD
jgi:hypothetical protein